MSKKVGFIDIIKAIKGLTVAEAIEKIRESPDLKFLLTTAGIWLVVRYLLIGVFLINFIYLFSRIVTMVLS